MMSKMGWEQGQGLGKEKQGMTKSIRAKKRVDQLGLGADKSKKDSFVEAYDMFGAVLKRLNEAKDAGEDIATQDEIQSAKANHTNLAQELATFNAQKHLYNKFRASKDVSNYSKQHMSEIFGGMNTNGAFGKATVTASYAEQHEETKVLEKDEVLDQVVQAVCLSPFCALFILIILIFLSSCLRFHSTWHVLY